MAETIDYSDFYHWQANVAEDTIVAHENLLCVSVADPDIYYHIITYSKYVLTRKYPVRRYIRIIIQQNSPLHL